MDAEIHDLPRLVRLDPPEPVEVLDGGEWWPGEAQAYRGRRVRVLYSKGPGMRYSTWEPAEKVRRV